MGEIRSPNLRAMQIKRAAPLRRSALIKHQFVNFWKFYLSLLELFMRYPGNISFVYYLAFTNGGCAGMTILTQTCMIEHACCLRTEMDSALTD